MKYAIDRIKIGFEEDVSANEFFGIYIPQRTNRFFCPECGEPVFWKSRGGNKQNDEFSHYRQTEKSPECDKRVDGKSELNLYERVGLPMRLARLGESGFALYVIFPAIGERLLDIAVKQKSQICISGTGRERGVPINFTYFRATAATPIPVDFIPNYGVNYVVQVNAIPEIKRKWSDYSDGFARNGAMFTYEEAGGKKIRNGDSISTGRQYYIVAKEFHSPYDEIAVERVGSIRLNETIFSVYLASINVSVNDEYRYTEINNYLKTHFGVSLLETMPGLIPLWPPIAEQDVLIPVKNASIVYCAVSSGNSVPKVYTYKASNVALLTVHQNGNDLNTVMVPMGATETVVSVDRKYAGRELVFQSKPLSLSNFAYDISLEKQGEVLVDLDSLTASVLSSDLTLKSNAKMELYVGSHDKTYLHISVRSPKTSISPRRNSEEIILVVDNGILQTYVIKKTDAPYIYEQEILRQISENYRGEYVPAPRWVGLLLNYWQRNGQLTLVSAVRRSIQNGKIPCGLLNVLLINVPHK
ncbi:hypothetical protein LJC42_00105 [Eubacteriales bacterium OttesenSCG-928-K08]|nr:hypothetical protein [Eubacteriales bacterium OttesenSCG-928-K08]